MNSPLPQPLAPDELRRIAEDAYAADGTTCAQLAAKYTRMWVGRVPELRFGGWRLTRYNQFDVPAPTVRVELRCHQDTGELADELKILVIEQQVAFAEKETPVDVADPRCYGDGRYRILIDEEMNARLVEQVDGRAEHRPEAGKAVEEILAWCAEHPAPAQ